MKPRRPDSAKSHVTKITQDSQFSKNNLNASKFSETFSSGVNSVHQKGDEFKQYVAEKDKDPRFKHLKSKMQVIQQKNPQLQISKTSFKPFERKKDKTSEKMSNKKIEQKIEKIEKEQQQLNLSRGFAEKNKQKMNSLKLEAIQQKQQQQKVKQIIKSKIKFDAFKFNKPGEKKQVKKVINGQKKQQEPSTNRSQLESKQVKVQSKKNKITQQQRMRQTQYRNIQKYVNDIQARNIMLFPSNYDSVINNTSMKVQDLDKIDLKDFINQPTEGDYQILKAKINKMDEQLDVDQSIDLQSLINQKTQLQEDQKAQNFQDEEIYASMSTSQIRKRNAFITQILAGKISKKQIQKIEQMERRSIRMHKIEHQKQDEDIQFTQINMMKRQTNRLMERNKLQAVGQLYRDCDYLSQQHKQRLEQLLNGDLEQSPFQCNELQAMQRKRIDQSIRMYRQMAGDEDFTLDIFNQESLPKDPINRKNAEQKILKQRVSNVNERLSNIDKIVVTKSKIESLIKKFEHTRTSSNYQLICKQNQTKFQDQMAKLSQAERMLVEFSQTQDMDLIIKEIQAKFRQMEEQIRRLNQMDAQQLMKLQKQRLRMKLKEAQQIEKLIKQVSPEIDNIAKIKKDIQQQLKIYDQLEYIQIPQIRCQGFKESQTLEDIDALITKKWQMQAGSNQINHH